MNKKNDKQKQNSRSENCFSPEKFIEAIPVELFDNILDAGETTARKYLRDNGAPEQLVDLLSWLVFYAGFVVRKRSNNTQADNELALDGIPEAIKEILDLGGDLTGQSLAKHREPIPWNK
jgi:hypothetical protein